jgi:hypothetical protein
MCTRVEKKGTKSCLPRETSQKRQAKGVFKQMGVGVHPGTSLMDEKHMLHRRGPIAFGLVEGAVSHRFLHCNFSQHERVRGCHPMRDAQINISTMRRTLHSWSQSRSNHQRPQISPPVPVLAGVMCVASLDGDPEASARDCTTIFSLHDAVAAAFSRLNVGPKRHMTLVRVSHECNGSVALVRIVK